MSAPETEKQTEPKPGWFDIIEMLGKHPRIAAIVGFVAVVLVWGFYLRQFSGGLSDSQETWGQFGDFVGGTLNSVFGFLGFLILLRSLRIQSEELVETREELKKSGQAQKSQAKYAFREERRRYHTDAISFFMDNEILPKLENVTVWVGKAQDDHIVDSSLRRIMDKNLDSRKSLDESGYVISDNKDHPISLIEQKIKFLDIHCYNPYKLFPLSPVLYRPINTYEDSVLFLLNRGWITDLKFFGKHDFPLR